jgi:hypothetical protein
VTTPQPLTRLEALPAYLLSAVTTLLWVACVLPSGTPVLEGASNDAATPIHRVAILLVPGLLLLVAVPAGCSLSQRRRGLRAVLASTDAFVSLSVAIALWAEHLVLEFADGPEGVLIDWPLLVGSFLLVAIGALSIIEVWRCTRPNPRPEMPGRFAGLRLGICVLVLVLPLQVLVTPDVERASLLAPFLFVAISAGGVRLARGMRGLRRTAALLQLLLAAHVLVTVRYAIYRSDPLITDVNIAGRVAIWLALATAGLALLQVLLHLRREHVTAPRPRMTG